MLKPVAVAIAAAAMLAGCSSGGSQSGSSPSASDESVHWGYEGADGPTAWGSLSPDFAECATGRRQSPISIENPKKVNRPSPVVKYRAQPGLVTNNGHTVQVTSGPGNTMTIGGKAYDLMLMHFHAPAETVLEGKTYPLELHFVHESAAGSPAVLAVLLTEGPENPAFDSFIAALGTPEGAEATATIDWPGLVPAKTKTVRFDGSLTTPECTQGYAWNVATTPVEVSAEQIAAFRAVYDNNARPVQPLNGRSVTIDAG